jgi:hypothetical protein
VGVGHVARFFVASRVCLRVAKSSVKKNMNPKKKSKGVKTKRSAIEKTREIRLDVEMVKRDASERTKKKRQRRGIEGQ